MNEFKVKRLEADPDEERSEREELFVRLLLTGPGGVTNLLATICPNADWKDTYDDLKRELDRVEDGDLSLADQILVSQAQALQAVFTSQMQRAVKSQYLDQSEHHAKIAFRAQNQCLRTLRTLLEFKNPKRATFIKQQNNLQLNQTPENSEKNVKPANELLDAKKELNIGMPIIGNEIRD